MSTTSRRAILALAVLAALAGGMLAALVPSAGQNDQPTPVIGPSSKRPVPALEGAGAPARSRPASPDPDLIARRLGRVRGVVRAAQGAAEPAAVVTLKYRLQESPLARGTSSASGEFDIEFARTGSGSTLPEYYLLEAVSADGTRISYPTEVAAAAGEWVIDGAVVVLESPAEVVVRVQSGNGQPVPGAEIHLFRRGPGDSGASALPGQAYPREARAFADATGVWRGRPLPGSYWLRSRRDSRSAWGAARAVFVADSAPSEPITLVVADRTAVVELRVRESDGAAVPGAWVSFAQRDLATRASTSPWVPAEQRLGADEDFSGYEDLFRYADELGRLSIPIDVDAREPTTLAVGSPLHQIVQVQLHARVEGATVVDCELAIRPSCVAEVSGPGDEAWQDLLRWTAQPTEGRWELPFPEASGADYLHSALARACVRHVAPRTWVIHVPYEGPIVVRAELPGGVGASVGVRPSVAAPPTVGMELPASRRMHLWIPDPEDRLDAVLAAHPRSLDVLVREDGNPGLRRACEWLLPAHGADLEVWVRSDATDLLVLGRSALDDLPGLPASVDLRAQGTRIDLPVALDRVGWLALTWDGARSESERRPEVRLQPLDSDEREGATPPHMRRARGWWLDIPSGGLAVALAPGRYVLRTRRDGVWGPDLTGLVLAGQSRAIVIR